MLFIGKSLNHVRTLNNAGAGHGGLPHVSSKLQELARLTFPLESSDFSKSIKEIRASLSQNTLQKLLPLTKVAEMLQLLRDFFLLGRGEFALALTHEADEKIRNRWRRAGNLAYEKDDGLKNITVKDGEVTAVLNRAWAVLVSLQGQHAEEDDQLELARSLIQLHLVKSRSPAPLMTGKGLDVTAAELLAASPFRSMLFSVPAMLYMDLPAPLDMVMSASDLQLYSCISSYLLSLRRAHIRLTDLWKITSLRRHYPAPRGAGDHAFTLRERWQARSSVLRSSWTTASAAIFFLGETEAYFQTEVVEGLWEGFSNWLAPSTKPANRTQSGLATPLDGKSTLDQDGDKDMDMDWLDDSRPTGSRLQRAATAAPAHDPQTLSVAHTLYLRTLVHRLLLTQPAFTDPLYALLSYIDHLVSHLHRLHSIFTSLDLEADAGVVDAFVDLEREERQVVTSLRSVESNIKQGIEGVVAALRALESNDEFLAEWDGQGLVDEEVDLMEDKPYAPGRIGGVDRLLMKLDFGSWLGSKHDGWT